MNIAILAVSSLSLIASAGCLVILVRGAKEARLMQSEFEDVKAKTTRNAAKLAAVFKEMEV